MQTIFTENFIKITVPSKCIHMLNLQHQALFVADDFGYVCLDKGKRELVNVVEDSKHNAETSHAQRPKQ